MCPFAPQAKQVAFFAPFPFPPSYLSFPLWFGREALLSLLLAAGGLRVTTSAKRLAAVIPAVLKIFGPGPDGFLTLMAVEFILREAASPPSRA